MPKRGGKDHRSKHTRYHRSGNDQDRDNAADPFTPGKTIVFSRSGTLMYEVAFNLSRNGFGQKICLGIEAIRSMVPI